MAPFSHFVWTHTEETVQEAKQRVRRGLPRLFRRLQDIVMIIGLCVVVGGEIALFTYYPWWAGVIGLFVLTGAMLEIMKLCSALCCKYYGIDYVELLLSGKKAE